MSLSENAPLQVRLHPWNFDALDRLAAIDGKARSGTARDILALDVEKTRAIAQARLWLATGDAWTSTDARFQVHSTGETLWSVFANGLRYLMLRAGIAREQLDDASDDHLIGYLWPAFIEASRQSFLPYPPEATTGALIVEGAPHGQPGKWVLMGGEVWPGNEPFPIPREDLMGRYEADEPAADETGGAQ